MADSATINSPDYWNHRFAVDWTARGGAEQTSFFARLAIEMLPDWFWAEAANGFSFVDVGCALGEALSDFRARLPRSKLTGVDVSKVAIRMAKQRLPDFHFRAVKEDWSDAPRGDIMFCSNTLEHMKDWKKRLARLSELADHYVLALTPFQEWARIDEHVVTFDFTAFPPALPDGRRLLYLRILDAGKAPKTHWPGHQVLAIYGAKVSAADAPMTAASFDPYVGVDFRGRPVAQVKAALLALQAAYPDVQARDAHTQGDSDGGVVERINAEWSQKLEASVAEMNAKHAELRTHYERVLGERDARIAQLSELQAWRQRAQELENALRDSLTQQLQRSEQEAKTFAEQATDARIEVAQVKAEAAHAGRMAQQAAALELEQLRAVLAAKEHELTAIRTHAAKDVAAAKHEAHVVAEALTRARAEADQRLGLLEQRRVSLEASLAQAQAELEEARMAVGAADEARANGHAAAAEFEREIESLRADIKRVTADNSALKAAIRHAIDERDQARSGQNAGAPIARVQSLEAELAAARAEAEARAVNIAALRVAVQNLVAQLDPTLTAVRDAWEADYARLSSRNMLLEQDAQALRKQLTRILGSKSLKIGTSLRQAYWTVLGQPRAPIETTPDALPPALDAGSEFLRVWDAAKKAADAARWALAEAPQTAPRSPPPARIAPAPAPSALAFAPPPMTQPAKQGRVIALQAASLGSGGLERVVFDTAVGLKARGETVIAIAVSSGGAFAEELRQRDIAVHEVNRDLATYESVLRGNGVTDLFAHHSYFGYERAASLGIGLYDVVHNYYFWHRQNDNMIRRVAELSTLIVYVSSAVRTFHERVFGVPHEKGVVINNPAHVDGLIVPEKAQLRRLRERPAETFFLNVAQAFPSKAQPAMITAFARAYRKNPSIRLQIAGAPVKNDVEQAVKARIEAENVGDVVELLGHCDRRKMSRLYAQAHAFVLPSLYEGYSVSAIEAATYGLPLILTCVGGAKDLITRSGCGILLPPASDDLEKFDPAAIEKFGLERENAATAALEQAFLTVASDRTEWISRGLEAHYDIRTLDEVIDAYLATMAPLSHSALQA